MGDSDASRRALHLKALYLEGDLDLAAYRAQRAGGAAELAALPLGEGNPDERVGRRLAGFLADLASTWKAATPAERNKIARQLFVEVIVENRTAVAVVPRPDVRPFVETLACQVPDEVTRWRKRRGSLAPFRHMPDDAVVLAAPAPDHPRYTEPRPGKLTSAQVEAVASSVAAGRTLRDVAAEFGISAERVRQLARLPTLQATGSR